MGFQELARSVIWIYVFVLCLSVGLWWFGNQFNIPAIADKSLPLDELADDYNATSQTYAGGAGFNPAFIFGDFPKAITDFMSIIFGGYLYKTLLLFGFPGDLVTGLTALTGFLVVGSLVYLVSGRS